MSLIKDIDALAESAKGAVRKVERVASSATLREAYVNEIDLLLKEIDRKSIPEHYRNLIISDYGRFWLSVAKGE